MPAYLPPLMLHSLTYPCISALALAGLLPTSSVAEVTALHSASIQALAPDAVALVDAFDHDDFSLDSAVGERLSALKARSMTWRCIVVYLSSAGRYDGDVYNGLLERAQWSPLNRADVLPLFEKVSAL